MPIERSAPRYKAAGKSKKALLFLVIALMLAAVPHVSAASPVSAAQAKKQAENEFSAQVIQDLRGIYLSAPSIDANAAAGITALTLLAYWNDEAIYQTLRSADTPSLTRAAGVAATLAGPATDLAVAGAIALKDPETGYLAANAIIYAGIATEVLKFTFGVTRPRAQAGHEPHPFRYFEDGIHDSMPSGHTSTAFALARVLAERYPKYRAAIYAAATAVGLSRIYASAHWPSDVIAGAAVGIWSADQVMGRSHLLRWEW